jgi:hypothetical protein
LYSALSHKQVLGFPRFLYVGAAGVKRKMKPNRRHQAPTKSLTDTLILSRTEDRAPLASDPSADPEAGMGGQDGLSAFRKHPGTKAINAKRVAAPPGFTSSR